MYPWFHRDLVRVGRLELPASCSQTAQVYHMRYILRPLSPFTTIYSHVICGQSYDFYSYFSYCGKNCGHKLILLAALRQRAFSILYHQASTASTEPSRPHLNNETDLGNNSSNLVNTEAVPKIGPIKLYRIHIITWHAILSRATSITKSLKGGEIGLCLQARLKKSLSRHSLKY